MRSSNPVFSRRGFSRDNGYAGFNTAQGAFVFYGFAQIVWMAAAKLPS